MNGERHGGACASPFSALLIIKRAPFGPRISNLVSNHETAGHADNLGSVIVADELRTLTLGTQSSRSRTRRNSRYLFQRLSQVFFLMLLILLDLVEDPDDERATNTPKFVVADLCADYWYWILFESKEKIATL